MEYAAEGRSAPMVALRDGRFKLIALRRPIRRMLFDLEADPHELAQPRRRPRACRALAALCRKRSRARWDLAAFDAAVRESQARRRVVYAALRNGAYYPWDYQPLQNASERYMRNHMDLNVLEAAQRGPRVGE